MRDVETSSKGWKVRTAETRCTTCMSSIPAGATVCVNCGAFQKKWPNTLKFIAATSGALTIMGSLLVFTITKLPEVRKIVAWRDSVQVLSFVKDRDLIVSNTGDGEVLLQYILITRPMTNGADATMGIPVEKAVKAGNILIYNFPKTDGAPDLRKAKGTYVLGGSKPITDEWIGIANKAIDERDCYSLEFRLASDAGYLQVLDHYQKELHSGVMTLPHTAKIYYYSIRERKVFSEPFDIVAMVLRGNPPGCVK